MIGKVLDETAMRRRVTCLQRRGGRGLGGPPPDDGPGGRAAGSKPGTPPGDPGGFAPGNVLTTLKV